MPTEVATETANTSTKTRKPSNISPAQKQASSLRRDAAMLERLAQGSSDPTAMLADAAKLRTQADALAPASVQPSKVKSLTDAEWEAVETYFLSDLRVRLQEGFSLAKLKKIATPAAA